MATFKIFIFLVMPDKIKLVKNNRANSMNEKIIQMAACKNWTNYLQTRVVIINQENWIVLSV